MSSGQPSSKQRLELRDVMKSVPAWLGTIFGTLGTAICLVLLIATWMTCSKLRATVDRGTSAVIALITRLDEGASAMDERVEHSRLSLKDFSGQLQQRLGESRTEPLILQPAAEKLYRQSIRLSDQLQEWQNYAATIREVTLLIDEIFRSFPGLTPPDAASEKPILTAIESAQQHLETAKSAVDELAERVDPMERPPNRDLFSKFVQPRVEQIDEALLRVIAGSEAVAKGVSRIEETILDSSQRLRRILILAGLGATLLITWLGAGQVCLARIGWQELQRQRKAS